MTPQQWRLAHRITEILATEPALTERQLAERLDATAADVHRVVGMLLGRRQLERCGDYLALASQPPAGGDAA
jgi:hypothetical protein